MVNKNFEELLVVVTILGVVGILAVSFTQCDIRERKERQDMIQHGFCQSGAYAAWVPCGGGH